MKVKVKFFSIYRDVVNTPEIELEVEEELTIKMLIDEVARSIPKLKYLFNEVPPVIFVNGEVVDEDKVIEDGAEIAIAPPASGGLNVRTSLFRDDVSIDEVFEETVSEGVGAVAIFIGVVKGDVEGRKVYELVYEVYEPYATKVLEKIAKDEMSKHNLYAVRIHHRVGSAKPGQKTIVIAVASSSRENALKALRDILERVKTEVPIYKLEKRDDGEYWVVGDGRRVPRVKTE